MVDFSSRDWYVLDGGLGTEVEKACPDILVSYGGEHATVTCKSHVTTSALSSYVA